MTCCDSPYAVQDKTHTTARCTNCGFPYTFAHQGKGKFKSKTPKWGPAWFCADNYDRSWRLKNFDRHEVIGTRRRGKREDYVVCCPKFGNTFSVSADNPPDEVYCGDCDRNGLLGPMLNRYRERKGNE